MALFTLSVQDGTPVDLPRPPKGYTDTLEKVGSTQVTMAGSRIQQTVAVKRTWTFAYQHLSAAEYATLRGFFDGTLGLGPFELRTTGDTTVYLVNVLSLNHTVPITGSHHVELSLAQV